VFHLLQNVLGSLAGLMVVDDSAALQMQRFSTVLESCQTVAANEIPDFRRPAVDELRSQFDGQRR
jgi:hypothetical protein